MKLTVMLNIETETGKEKKNLDKNSKYASEGRF